jgi:hypothetical protein
MPTDATNTIPLETAAATRTAHSGTGEQGRLVSLEFTRPAPLLRYPATERHWKGNPS